MSESIHASIIKTLSTTVKNKSSKNPNKKSGTNMKPPPGYLQGAQGQHKVVLFRNGGRLLHQASKLYPGQILSINLAHTCSLDNFLLCLAYQYINNFTFSNAIDTSCIPHYFRDFFLDMSTAKNQNDAALARYKFIDASLGSVPNSGKGKIFLRGKVLNFDFFDSERDVANAYLRPLLSSSRTEQCSVCSYSRCFEYGVLDIPGDLNTRKLQDPAQFIANEYESLLNRRCPQ
jgi:hypothetical protein